VFLVTSNKAILRSLSSIFNVIVPYSYYFPTHTHIHSRTFFPSAAFFAHEVYLIPSDDPHLSEYVPAAYMRRGYMTDFHGSAGTALVTTAAAVVNNDKEEDASEVARERGGDAYLWTDSRYHNEASLRLDSNHWKLMKQGLPKVPSIPKFLADMAVKHYQTFGRPLVVGLDAYVHSAAFARELKEAFGEAAKDVVEVEVDDTNGLGTKNDDAAPLSSSPPVIGIIDTLDGLPNIVDSIWAGRPALPKNPFRVQVSLLLVLV
jgi:Xaa-Pro aminopeptidase